MGALHYQAPGKSIGGTMFFELGKRTLIPNSSWGRQSLTLSGASLLALMLNAVAGCSGSLPSGFFGALSVPTAIRATNASVPIRKGDEKDLLPFMRAPDGQIWAQPLLWTSSNLTVASVDPNTGHVKAVATGSSILTATSTTDSTQRAMVEVVVTDPGTMPGPVNAAGITTGLKGSSPPELAPTQNPWANLPRPSSGNGTKSPRPTPGPPSPPKPALYVETSGVKANLDAVQFLDLKTGFAAGDQATIIGTTDGGETWTPLTSDLFRPEDYFKAISFVDAKTGWISSDTYGRGHHIYHTQDGGKTWQDQTVSKANVANTSGGVQPKGWGLTFTSATVGYTDGFATQDGGKTWTPQGGSPGGHVTALGSTLFSANVDGFFRYSSGLGWAKVGQVTAGVQGIELSFISPTEGWALSDNYLSHTTDGGATWTGSSVIEGGSGVQFLDRTHGFVVGYDGTEGVLEVTADGGGTWTAIPLPVRSPRLFGVSMIDASNGWAVGNNGTIVRYAIR
jgi:photosystem II stability/assembly factor-like uncharacterized protein